MLVEKTEVLSLFLKELLRGGIPRSYPARPTYSYGRAMVSLRIRARAAGRANHFALNGDAPAIVQKSLTAFLGREIGGRVATTTSELATIILEEAKVAIVPGAAFGAPGYARLSFALGDDDLGEGLTRMGDLLTS